MSGNEAIKTPRRRGRKSKAAKLAELNQVTEGRSLISDASEAIPQYGFVYEIPNVRSPLCSTRIRKPPLRYTTSPIPERKYQQRKLASVRAKSNPEKKNVIVGPDAKVQLDSKKLKKSRNSNTRLLNQGRDKLKKKDNRRKVPEDPNPNETSTIQILNSYSLANGSTRSQNENAYNLRRSTDKPRDFKPLSSSKLLKKDKDEKLNSYSTKEVTYRFGSGLIVTGVKFHITK